MTSAATKLLITLCLLICFSINLKAQFNISGEFKTRGEYRGGYISLLDSSKTPYADLLGRARLLFDYKNEKITTRFSVHNAWVFGQNHYSSDTITKNTVNIYEAWFKYNFNPSFAFKVGRMEVSYDDERLFGASNWNMWGATHDIVILQYEMPRKTFRGDAGFAINNIAPVSYSMNSYNMGKNYKYMGYLYLNKKILDNKISLSLLGVVDAFQKNNINTTKSFTKTDTLIIRNEFDSIIGTTIIKTPVTTSSTEEFIHTLYARATIGAGLLFDHKKLSFFVNGYYQAGHHRDGRELSSNFYAAWISYKVIKPLKIQLGYEHLSGNDFSDTATFKTRVTGFSGLYGTAHRHYGYMDMFSSLVRDNLSPGLNYLYAKGTLSLNDKMSVEASYRWYSLPHGYLLKPTKSKPFAYLEVSKTLGSEIDLMYIYKPVPNLELNAAYCFFLPTATMEAYNGLKTGTARFAQFVYVMITYKPNFFNTDKR
ncbi:MAG: alginate export family protein [Bacteroidales bacterium]|nr:alginate export family protein [Bacteroidales bacterium]